MTKHAIPDAVLAAHTAVLGMTGSGKTSTEKLIVEQVVAAGARVCVLDTLKSDWWGITSSASGKSAGLPFKILGGPRGHVPLHSSAGKVIGNLVGTGKLPLSIIDMADFEAGGIQRFFVDFAQSLWRSVRGVVYLVIEEAHEVAPKERAGFGAENMAIHWAKKLGTGSRTKGIRLIVATQRVQSLHNAVLGSCQTVIAHQLMFDADQDPVVKWVKSINKAAAAEVANTIASLPPGTGWLCSGRAQIFEKVHFPKFKTFDNTATPEGDAADIDVKTAAVDQDELKALIGDAVKEAEATDVKALQKKVGELERKLTAAEKAPAATETIDRDALQLELMHAKVEGYADAMKAAAGMMGGIRGKAKSLSETLDGLLDNVETIERWAAREKGKPTGINAVTRDDVERTIRAPGSPAAHSRPQSPVRAGAAATTRKPLSAAGGDGALSGPQQRIVDAIRWWNVLGVSAPTHPQVGFIAGYSHNSGTWSTYLGQLRTLGLIEGRGELVLTDAGLTAANEPSTPPTGELLRARVLDKLDGPLRRIMGPVIEVYPGSLTHAAAGEAAGYSHQSGTWSTYLGRARSLDLLEGRGELRAQDWLFP